MRTQVEHSTDTKFLDRRTSLHGSLQFASGFEKEDEGPKASLLNLHKVGTNHKVILGIFFVTRKLVSEN